MLTSYLNKLFNHQAEISSLDDRMARAYKIDDLGEKVLEYGSISDDAAKTLRQAKTPSRWAEAGYGLGIAMEAAAFFAGGWALMLGGLAVACAANYVCRNIGRDARDDLAALREMSHTMESELSQRLTARDVESSSSRDKLLARYPALRNTFEKAANGNAAPVASAPRNTIKSESPSV